MMDTAILRSRILDLAIRGKLVEQDPSEGTAEELLVEIGRQRGRTIEPITDEVPFEIPDSWRWVRLGEISNYGNCISSDISEIPQDSWILELEDLEKETARIIQRLSLSERQIKGIRRKFDKGDILYSKLRTYLNKVLIAPEDGYCTSEIVPIVSYAHNPYLCVVLRSPYFLRYTAQLGYGVKMPRLGKSDALKSLIPLPPLAEQKRIVERVEELLKLVDAIETAQADIKQISSILRSRVLDKAMNGELTSASVDKWEYARIGDICKTTSGGTPQAKNPVYYGGNIPWLQSGELHQKYIYDTSKKITQEGYDNSSAKYYPINSVLIALYGATVGEVAIAKIQTTSNQAICAIFPSEKVNEEYLYYFLKTMKATYINMASGGAQPNISQEKVKNTIIPLPPLAEQHRIVSKIEEIFAQIDELTI